MLELELNNEKAMDVEEGTKEGTGRGELQDVMKEERSRLTGSVRGHGRRR